MTAKGMARTFSRGSWILALGACAAAPSARDAPAAQAQTNGQAPESSEGPAATTTAAVASSADAVAPSTESATASAAPAPPPSPPEPCPDGMVLIAGGSFEVRVGRGKEKRDVEPFCIDKTEVTTSAYQQCIADEKCTAAWLTACDGATISVDGKGEHPIVCVDLPQAEAYCGYAGKRLPFDHEWEWAARGRDEARTYAWGDEPPKDQLCWSGGGKRTETCAVGKHTAGATRDGVLDMTGNVLEWVRTPYDDKVEDRSARGGSWRDGVRAMVKVARPMWFKASYRCGFLGIRCVTTPNAASTGGKGASGAMR
jgi:formylglycine-generating enzyme required for sulfatase activity